MGQKQDRHLHDQQEDQQHDWPGYYKCDELVPPLCDDTLTVTTGTVETLPGLMVTYWKYTPADQDRSKFPIVVINGGPGLPHNFMKPLRNFACDGREVVMYDQAGTGWSQLSKHQEKKDAYPELFDIQYYAETELPALLDELGWKRYHVLASSWGTQIAFQYAVTMEGRGHGGIESLILNAPIADNHKFIGMVFTCDLPAFTWYYTCRHELIARAVLTCSHTTFFPPYCKNKNRIPVGPSRWIRWKYANLHPKASAVFQQHERL